MAELLYIGTHGTDDPTNATFPFLMAKGAIEAGQASVHAFGTVGANIRARKPKTGENR